eukprot:scaffold263215_cov39-Prasinocladus_malaysianus.AAC.5
MVGYPPFYSDDPMQTCRKIVNWRLYLKFPPEAKLSPAAKDLIQRLLCDVDDRLGTMGGLEEIKAHPFFRGVDWENIYSQTPPYRPTVEHELDTQNFEHFAEDGSMQQARGRRWGKTDPNFVGYTYKNWEAVATDETQEVVKLGKKKSSRPSLSQPHALRWIGHGIHPPGWRLGKDSGSALVEPGLLFQVHKLGNIMMMAQQKNTAGSQPFWTPKLLGSRKFGCIPLAMLDNLNHVLSRTVICEKA